MSTDVHVDLQGLLGIKGISLRAELNGSIDEVLRELRTASPDVHYVDHLMEPVLLIYVPGIPCARVVTVVEAKVVFSCSPTFLRNLLRYCEAMELGYTIIKE